VSKGPKTSTVPDVTSTDLGSAEQTLQASGFKAKVVYQDVSDPNEDGIVLDENPPGGTQAKPKTEITLTVGRAVSSGGTTTATTPATTTTP
jgi:serine/threonine-protein kinase